MDLLWKYNAGFAFAKPLPGNFSLASELVYTRQGGSLEADRSGKYITEFDYISLPVLVRFKPDGKDVFVQAGGKFSYLINSERIHIGNSNTSTLDDLNNLRQWDAGVANHIPLFLLFFA